MSKKSFKKSKNMMANVPSEKPTNTQPTNTQQDNKIKVYNPVTGEGEGETAEDKLKDTTGYWYKYYHDKAISEGKSEQEANEIASQDAKSQMNSLLMDSDNERNFFSANDLSSGGGKLRTYKKSADNYISELSKGALLPTKPTSVVNAPAESPKAPNKTPEEVAADIAAVEKVTGPGTPQELKEHIEALNKGEEPPLPTIETKSPDDLVEQSLNMFSSSNPNATRAEAKAFIANQLYKGVPVTRKAQKLLDEMFPIEAEVGLKNENGIILSNETLSLEDEYMTAAINNDEKKMAQVSTKLSNSLDKDKKISRYIATGGNGSETDKRFAGQYNDMQTLISYYKEKLHDPEVDAEAKSQYRSEIEQLEGNSRALYSHLLHSYDEVLNMSQSIDDLDSIYEKRMPMGITTSLFRNLRSANAQLEDAMISGDPVLIQKAKDRKADVIAGHISYYLDTLGTAIGNIRIGESSPNKKSRWQTEQDSYLAADLEAHNEINKAKMTEAKDFLVDNLRADSSIIENINQMNSTSANARLANRLNKDQLIYSAYAKEALGKALVNIDSDSLLRAVMYSAEGNYAMLYKVLSTIDTPVLEDVVNSLSDVITSLGGTASGIADSLTELLDYINGFINPELDDFNATDFVNGLLSN